MVKSVGVGDIDHEGDAGASEYWVCFTDTSIKSPEKIWFTASEIDGDSHLIGGFDVIQTAKEKPTSKCPQLPKNIHFALTRSSISLRSSQTKLRKWLGTPSKISGDWWIYVSQENLPNDFIQLGLSGFRFSNGKLIELFSSQSTTN